MKRLILLQALLFIFLFAGAQSLEEIVKKNYDATGQAAIENAKTLKITAVAFMGPMDMSMVIYRKNPNKVRVNMLMEGMEMVQAFDGVKGYTINPMMGGNDVTEMPASEAQNMQNQGNFAMNLLPLFKDNKLEMAGEVNVSGKPAWKIKAVLPSGDVSYVYIDKATYRQVRTDAWVSQMGMDFSLETYLTDYTDFNGVMLPKTVSTYANGEEMMAIIIEKVEINIDLDDKLFTLK